MQEKKTGFIRVGVVKRVSAYIDRKARESNIEMNGFAAKKINAEGMMRGTITVLLIVELFVVLDKFILALHGEFYAV